MANRFRVNTTEFSDGSTINSGQLIPSSGYPSADWNARYLFDTGSFGSVDWGNRVLSDGNASPSLYYGARILTGVWNAQGLQVQGNNVVTGGPYYLNTNPSGFITTGQTGNFGGGGNTSNFALLTGNNNFSGINTFSGGSGNFYNGINIWDSGYNRYVTFTSYSGILTII